MKKRNQGWFVVNDKDIGHGEITPFMDQNVSKAANCNKSHHKDSVKNEKIELTGKNEAGNIPDYSERGLQSVRNSRLKSAFRFRDTTPKEGFP
jgi:hypothetical protein